MVKLSNHSYLFVRFLSSLFLSILTLFLTSLLVFGLFSPLQRSVIMLLLSSYIILSPANSSFLIPVIEQVQLHIFYFNVMISSLFTRLFILIIDTLIGTNFVYTEFRRSFALFRSFMKHVNFSTNQLVMFCFLAILFTDLVFLCLGNLVLFCLLLVNVVCFWACILAPFGFFPRLIIFFSWCFVQIVTRSLYFCGVSDFVVVVDFEHIDNVYSCFGKTVTPLVIKNTECYYSSVAIHNTLPIIPNDLLMRHAARTGISPSYPCHIIPAYESVFGKQEEHTTFTDLKALQFGQYGSLFSSYRNLFWYLNGHNLLGNANFKDDSYHHYAKEGIDVTDPAVNSFTDGFSEANWNREFIVSLCALDKMFPGMNVTWRRGSGSTDVIATLENGLEYHLDITSPQRDTIPEKYLGNKIRRLPQEIPMQRYSKVVICNFVDDFGNLVEDSPYKDQLFHVSPTNVQTFLDKRKINFDFMCRKFETKNRFSFELIAYTMERNQGFAIIDKYKHK